MKFTNLLRTLRIRCRLSLKEAAARGNFSEAILRSWESGQSVPNVPSVIKLEKSYELPRGSLLDALGNADMNRIYISHPLRGNASGVELLLAVKENRKKVSQICMNILCEHNDVLILSPIHAFSFFPIGEAQAPVFAQCKVMLELADELWVYGDWQSSEGCQTEIRYAEILKIPVKYF